MNDSQTLPRPRVTAKLEENPPPAPAAGHRMRSRLSLMLDRLEVGQAVSVETMGERVMRTHASNAKRRNPGRRYVVRLEREEGVVRCWRVS